MWRNSWPHRKRRTKSKPDRQLRREGDIGSEGRRTGSLFVPPDRWFHQHFNVGETSARYLAFHPPVQFEGWADTIQDRLKDQIEFPDEDSFVREHFEAELAKRGLTTLMPEQAYIDKDYQPPSKEGE